MRKRQDETKALAARTKAIETLAPYVAEQAGIPPEMVEQYLQQDPGESPRSRYERLSEVMNQVITANTLKQQRQQLDTGALALEQRRRAEAEQGRITQYADKQLATAGQLARGVGTGVLRPEIQEEALRYAQSPAGQLRRQGVDLTPEMLYGYAQMGAKNAGNAKIGTTLDIGGQTFVWTNSNQITPLKSGKTNTATAPKVVNVNGRDYYQATEGGPFKPVPMPTEKPVEPMTAQLNAGRYTRKLQDIEELEGASKWFEGGKRKKAADLVKMKREANALAGSLGYALPFPADEPARKGGAAPAGATPGNAAAAPASPAKLYRVQGDAVSLSPQADPVEALQQALDDGQITQEQALKYLQSMGYSLKGAGK